MTLSRLRCRFGRHQWVEHPDFDIAPVRLCECCGRVEHRIWTGRWLRKKHLEAA